MIQRLFAPGGMRAAAIFIALGALLYLAAIIWAGFDVALSTLRQIGLPALLMGAVFASLGYGLRFMRWRLLLRQYGYVIPERRHFAIYLAGLALTPSPGKLGETLRSALLLPFGVTVERSLAAFVVDRMSDVLGITFLCTVAARFASKPLPVLEWLLLVAWLAATLFRRLMQHPRTAEWVEITISRWRHRPLRLLGGVLQAWIELWRPSRVPLYALMAAAAYGTQTVVFWAFVRLAGFELAICDAMTIFANATLFGAASMVPGGLGTTEGALVLQLNALGSDPGVSISVAIATRIVTLWCAVLMGLLALLHVSSARDR